MTRKNRRSRHRPVVGTGLGRGHGSNSKLAPIIERPLSAMERKAKKAGYLEPDAKCYSMGACSISVGSSPLGYHLSIAHPKRYPQWDECARARYELLPDDVTFGMLFPPSDQYVNVHNNCFHLWEVTGLAEGRKLETIGAQVERLLLLAEKVRKAEQGNEKVLRTMGELQEWLEAE